jgi:hypothetical protein
MEVVSVSPQLFTTVAQTGELKAKGSTDFMGMLTGMMANSVSQASQLSESGSEEMNAIIAEIFSMLQNDVSVEEVASKLLALTEEQKTALVETANQIISIISENAKPDDKKVKDILSLLSDDKKDIETALIYQILQMLGLNVNTVSNNTDNFLKIEFSTPQGVQVVTDTTPTQQSPTLIYVSENNQTQQIDFSKVSSMLNKLVDAANQNENLLQDVTVISNTIAEGKSELQDTEALQQSISKVLNEVKTVKGNSEFEDLLAYAQQSKTAQQINSQNVVEQKTEIPVQRQITQEVINQIESGITDETKEITLMLKPKELGEISIKLAKVGEEITVSIMAQNSTTQKLISERLPTLVSSLQEINSQVKDVMIVNPNENTNSFLGQFNLSQSDSREQYQQRQNFSTSNYDNKQVVEEPAQTSKVLIREGQLWQTA